MRKLLSLAVLAAVTTACSPVSAGDYLVYAIAYEPTDSIDPNCFGGEVPLDLEHDESTFRGRSTVGVFRSGDAYFLDTAESTLAGVKDGGALFFTGTNYDRDYYSQDDGWYTDAEVDLEIRLTISGAKVSGYSFAKTETSCTGDGCDPSNFTLCEQEANFVGSRVDDVDLTWGVGLE